MKLFLSSIRIPSTDERVVLFGHKEQISVVIVHNAWDPYSTERKKIEVAHTLSTFEEEGYKVSVLDLVASTNQQRQEALWSHDMLWVTGGNTFYINYYVQQTGFDSLIKEALAHGHVYGGASAGAIITGPTLHGAENADNPHDAPRILWDAMGLVDFGIVPHWGMEKYKAVLEKIKSAQKPYVSGAYTLSNEQALTYVNGAIEIR